MSVDTYRDFSIPSLPIILRLVFIVNYTLFKNYRMKLTLYYNSFNKIALNGCYYIFFTGNKINY